MRPQYHLPGVADGADALSDRMSRQAARRLTATVLAGVARGVGTVAPAGTALPTPARGPAAAPYDGGPGRSADGVDRLPDGGRDPVAVPLRAAGSPSGGPASPVGPAGTGGPPATATPRSGRDRLKPPNAAPPTARVFTHPGHAQWRLLFPMAVTREQVANWVFLGGGLPDGFSLISGLPAGLPGPAWYLTWADFRSRHPMDAVEFAMTLMILLTPYGQNLANRALLGGDATDEDMAAGRAEQMEKARRWAEYDREFVPALGMTRGEAASGLAGGPYEVNGQFVWIGWRSAWGRTIVETCPLSSNEVFNRDMRFYLRRGLSVKEAVAAFEAQWDEILGIELAFAGAGAGYRVPGAGNAAELENEAGLLGRRSARAQGILTRGDIALSRALAAADSAVIRTELVEQAEIRSVLRAETGARSASPARGALTDPVTPRAASGRRIGFAPPSAAPPAATDAAPAASAEYRPVAGFGRDRVAPTARPPGALPPDQGTHTQMPPARQVSTPSSGPGAVPGTPVGQRRGQPTTAMAGRPPSGDTPAVTPGRPAGGTAARGTAETAATDAERGRKLTVWEKNGKVTGDVQGLRRRLRSGDARTLDEARVEYDDLQGEIARGGKPHIEDYSEIPARRTADEVRSENISTATKSELENSGWLRKRLTRPEDRRDLMDWLKRGHREGELGKEPVPGKTVPKGHDHYEPGTPESEEMVKEWERTKGRRRD
ncbi:hypothetical protein [Streptomyces sp. AK08-02]|uniref:hypothetical protein n=1 Tax=Streptomyces sp. AK08-02 TaxID=3028654 RepID=UPI0029A225C6|nr:hypothetical protein [Streptomyces sp. AK08-02]MDX3748930.1 hypothetical protein [Streptomyces sp. AK08-02]